MTALSITSFALPGVDTAEIMSHAHRVAMDLSQTEGACPYPEGGDATAQAKRSAWLWAFREYRAAWRQAVAAGRDLSLGAWVH